MLPKILNYDRLYNTFNLNIPLKFNIASATIDKFANTNRVALKNIKFNGELENLSFGFIQKKSNQLANALDNLNLNRQNPLSLDPLFLCPPSPTERDSDAYLRGIWGQIIDDTHPSFDRMRRDNSI